MSDAEGSNSSINRDSSVILQIHLPYPLPTQYNVERSKELCLDGFNTVRGVGGGGRGEGRAVLVARGYNFACVKKRSNCITVPRLLSMIVVNLYGDHGMRQRKQLWAENRGNLQVLDHPKVLSNSE